VSRWTCPRCDREFERAHQAHVCAPGCTVDETFAGRAPVQREIYDALIAHLTTLGPVHVDAVHVGVFLKSDRKLAEVRPKARSLSLLLLLPRTIREARITRTIRVAGDRTVHVVELRGIDDVDQQLCEWLTEAYVAARRPMT
jgi:hypothetical protein